MRFACRVYCVYCFKLQEEQIERMEINQPFKVTSSHIVPPLYCLLRGAVGKMVVKRERLISRWKRGPKG